MAAEGQERHPRHALDPLVHQPIRFSILAMLSAADEVQFALLRDGVEVSDSVLSKQLALLEQGELIAVRKEFAGKYPRTWVRMTERGRTAYEAHLTALRAIVAATSSLPGDAALATRDDGSSR